MNCPICGNEAVALFDRQQQLGSVHLDSEKTRPLFMEGCEACYFVWNADAFAQPEAFETWMAPAYGDYQLLSADLHEFPLIDPRAEMSKAFLDLHCDWSQIHHVVEVGSNRGDFLAGLRSFYPELQLLGVESSPLPFVGIPTIFGDVRQIQLSSSFDLVVTRQVLEHMLYPQAFLQHIATFLREDGLLMVEVPDLENDLDEGIDPWVMEHVGHYSGRSLALLGEQAGLQLVAIDRGYQLTVLYRKSKGSTCLMGTGWTDRLERIRSFAEKVALSQQEWRTLTEEGAELCFYGASNVFLAVSGVLQQIWEGQWETSSKSLIDDYPHKHQSLVNGIKVQAWDTFAPKNACIYVICAMYRYHRQKMVQRVLDRLRPQDRLYTMWTPYN